MFCDFRLIWIAILWFMPSAARADMVMDGLNECILKKATVSQKQNIVRLTFASAFANPIISSIFSADAEKINNVKKEAMDDFVDLYTQQCRMQTMEALRAGRKDAITDSYEKLLAPSLSIVFDSAEVIQNYKVFLKTVVDDTRFKMFLSDVFR